MTSADFTIISPMSARMIKSTNCKTASVPVFTQYVENMAHILTVAEKYAKEKEVKDEVMLNLRLAPDMFPFVRQVQTVSDNAKGCCARLAGIEVPSMPDTEKTIAELIVRLQKTVAFLKTIKPEQIDGAENRKISIPAWKYESTGQVYLLTSGLPNFFFHLVTAYDILRNNGVPVGKMDYLAGSKK
ncbi:hypothetical protein CHS0354_035304 [Potamilus streckersoni]|uniref:DUF1993 domain-containing protein n=1 Tax=Potamilus streckersoni TaxID=2493646 RepID=A0AAE0S2Y6_9BIVA|nr:hypothetical protein CHS0354_035304 [Potamilus streckersoni]